jgi:hypothetical protein
MKRQPPAVWQWIEDQAGRYAQRDTRRPRPDAFLAAALDCLLWQWAELASLPAPDRASRYDRIQEAVKLLRSLEEADRYFTERHRATTEAGEKSPVSPHTITRGDPPGRATRDPGASFSEKGTPKA